MAKTVIILGNNFAGPMELSKIEINFKDLPQTDQKQTFIVNFALIDKTNQDSSPNVYILKNENKLREEDFQLIKNGFISIDHDSFIFIGLVESMDKKAKKIVLSNQNILFYQHLIIASGTKQAMLGYEFLAGVQTLIDALKVNKKFPNTFAEDIVKPRSNKTKKTKKTLQKDSSKDLTSLKLSKESPHTSLSDTSKRLYEIQI